MARLQRRLKLLLAEMSSDFGYQSRSMEIQMNLTKTHTPSSCMYGDFVGNYYIIYHPHMHNKIFTRGIMLWHSIYAPIGAYMDYMGVAAWIIPFSD